MFKMTSGGDGGTDSNALGSGGAGGVGLNPGGNAIGFDVSGGGGGGVGQAGGAGESDATPPFAAGGAAGTLGGGSGGNGGTITGLGGGGGGGGGGIGAEYNGLTSDLGAVIGGIAGGKGGNGGDAGFAGGSGGGGGAGGFGVLFEDSSSPTPQTVTIDGLIIGGNGGNGGRGLNGGLTGFETAGSGGDGGTGLLFLDTAANITITSSGAIAGGNAGAAGDDTESFAGHDGAAGAGIAGANLAIVDSGTIEGGFFTDNVTRADAIDFTGGVNSLELLSGARIFGNVVAFSTADSVTLGGSTDGILDFSVTQLQGFGSLLKTDSATWTLQGTTGADTPWTIESGILSVSSDGNLGNDTNSTIDALTFGGGTLKFLASATPFTTGRQIVLNADGTFDTNGNDATLAGLISGNGHLIKIDAGVLTLSHSNAYSGGTLLNGGTLDFAALGAAGSGQITFGANSEILKIENAALSAVTGTLESFGNPIQGFGVNDIIDLTGLTFAKNAKVSYNPNTDQLAVTSGAVTDTLTVVALPGGTTFAISSDGALGTDITLIGIATSGHGHHA
jgi:hypothetical protein